MKRLAMIIFAVIFLCPTANATLITIGNGLIYDDISELVWYYDTTYFYYDGADVTYHDALGLIDTMQGSTMIDGYEVSLNWRMAEVADMATLHPQLIYYDNRSMFTPHYQYFMDWNGYFIEWTNFTGIFGEAFTMPSSDDLFVFRHSITFQQPIYPREDLNDYPAWCNYMNDPWTTGIFIPATSASYLWVVADTTPVPEPATIMLVAIGLYLLVCAKFQRSLNGSTIIRYLYRHTMHRLLYACNF